MTNPQTAFLHRFSARMLAAGFVMALAVVPAMAAETTEPLMPTSKLAAGELTVTKSSNVQAAEAGDTIEYTVTVANTGGGDILNPALVDTLPDGMYFTEYKGQGQAHEFALGGTLAAGDRTAVTYKVTIRDEAAADDYINTAVATADNHDPVMATATVAVDAADQPLVAAAQPELTIRKTVSPASVKAGGEATFTLVISNAGPGMAKNVVVNDVLPAGLAYKDTSGGTRSWTLGDLEAGAKETIAYSVVVGNTVANGSYDNTAVVTADNHKAMKDTTRLTVERAEVLGVSTGTETGGQVLAETGASTGDVLMFGGAALSLIASVWTLRRLLGLPVTRV